MADRRRKNANWFIADGNGSIYQGPIDYRTVAVLMDIRDELQAINSKMSCYRIPRALDAMHELGVEARSRKRKAAAKRRAAKKGV